MSIEVLSLMKGAIEAKGSSPEQVAASAQTQAETPASARLNKVYLDDLFELASYSSVDSAGVVNASPYVAGTGRFGIQSSDNGTLDASIAETGAQLRSMRVGERTLCLGTGEFMYIPMRIAAELGQGVFFHSTTRSPVHPIDKPDYAIKSGQTFPSPEDEQVRNFFIMSVSRNTTIVLFLQSATGQRNVLLLCCRRCIHAVLGKSTSLFAVHQRAVIRRKWHEQKLA